MLLRVFTETIRFLRQTLSLAYRKGKQLSALLAREKLNSYPAVFSRYFLFQTRTTPGLCSLCHIKNSSHKSTQTFSQVQKVTEPINDRQTLQHFKSYLWYKLKIKQNKFFGVKLTNKRAIIKLSYSLVHFRVNSWGFKGKVSSITWRCRNCCH